MSTLEDSCCELRQDLARVETHYQALAIKLDEFDEYVGSYAASRLSQKLLILVAWIAGRSETLYREHRHLGYVCVLCNEDAGFTIHWMEKEEIVADKPLFAAKGFTVFSVDEAILTIVQMLIELDSNKWAAVLDWFKNYGKSPGLDLDKLSQTGLVGPVTREY